MDEWRSRCRQNRRRLGGGLRFPDHGADHYLHAIRGNNLLVVLHYRVSRGVGKSPEIFGLSEKYMGWLAIGLLLGFVVFGICRVMGQTTLGVVGLFATVGIAFWYCQSVSIKHGDHGMSKRGAYRKRPRILVTRSRSVFLNLKK